MNLCKDCKYYQDETWDSKAMCTRELSPVDNKPHKFCTIERHPWNSCGRQGRHWEPKPKAVKLTLWQRIKQTLKV